MVSLHMFKNTTVCVCTLVNTGIVIYFYPVSVEDNMYKTVTSNSNQCCLKGDIFYNSYVKVTFWRSISKYKV